LIELTAADVARLVGGELTGDPDTVVTGEAQTDSRLVTPGDLFLAMPGTVTDGHRFAAAAVDAGASLVIAERELELPVPVVVVPSSLTALWDLAREVVARVRAGGGLTVVAVTGSNGKTTTKNLLRAAFAAVGETVAPAGSFNNEVGAPISMLRVTEGTRFLVVEMGADAIGEIDDMVHRLVMPDIAIVLKVGLAHVGMFGGPEAIFRAKSELVRDLPETAIAVLNGDDARVAQMAGLTRATVHWFGSAEWTASGVEVTIDGTVFTLHHEDRAWPVRLPIIGEHHVTNALAAIAAADAAGVPPEVSVPAIEGSTGAERWRMERLEGPDGVTIINDAYNASPDSTSAALRTLAELTRGRRRAVAVLGHMAELGDWSVEEHDRIGRQAVRLNIDLLVVVGPEARAMYLAAQHEGSWGGEAVYAPSPDAAYDVLRGLLRSGDVVLVKSSKSAELRFLGDRLAGR